VSVFTRIPGIENKGLDKRRILVFFIFFALILLLFFTHLGINSPYTYGLPLVYPKSPPPSIEGYLVNWDAPVFIFAVDTLYGTKLPIDSTAISYVLGRPLPAFWASIFVGLTRSYMFGNYVANILALLLLCLVFMNFASRLGVSYEAIAVAGVGILLLPIFAHYIGQPLPYLTGIVISFLILLAIMSFSQEDYKNPVVLGLLTSLLFFSYDWIVFVVTVVIYFIAFYRFKKGIHYLYFFLAMFAPLILGTLSILIIKPAATSSAYSSFLKPVIKDFWKNWLEYFKHPMKKFSLPFQASQIGLAIAFKQLLAYIYWPLLLFTGYYLIKLRGKIKESRLFKLVFLLVGVFLLEQMLTAAFDWENNTRRAIPLIFAFAFLFTYVIAKTIDRRKVKYIVAIILIISFALTFADVLAKDPSIQANQYGEFMRWEPKAIMKYYEKRLTKTSLPNLERDGKPEFFGVKKAEVSRQNWWQFAGLQALLFIVLLALFYFLYKASLLSQYFAWALCGVFLASIIFRFI